MGPDTEPTADPRGRPAAAIPCVGAVVHDAAGRLLLVRRAHEPAAGLWSIPGGRVEGGEGHEQAVVREVLEETGLVVEVGALLGIVERDAPSGGVYVIQDFACSAVGGRLRAGDDAEDAAWFSAADLAVAATSPGLLEALDAWGVMPG